MTEVISHPPMTDTLPESSSAHLFSDSENVTPTPAGKDEVFWTELEIRRLGNLVAECIHTRRYVGDEDSAEVERQLMRSYIEAMKRKSMRVLHRAELCTRSGHAAWPGIDPSISDPVSLAEEYVRVVENYEALLSEEESRMRDVRKEAEEQASEKEIMEISSVDKEEWDVGDDVYRDGDKREAGINKTAEDKRKDLIGDVEGIRRRKKTADASGNNTVSYSKEDEELMSRHQPIQDELTSNLINLVGKLKESITENKESIAKDSTVLAETEDVVDDNISALGKQRKALKKFENSSSLSWWLAMVAGVVILLVFLLVAILMKVPF